jgi:hypothetical protein
VDGDPLVTITDVGRVAAVVRAGALLPFGGFS